MNILICGPQASGKSLLATALCAQLVTEGWQVCVQDNEIYSLTPFPSNRDAVKQLLEETTHCHDKHLILTTQNPLDVVHKKWKIEWDYVIQTKRMKKEVIRIDSN